MNKEKALGAYVFVNKKYFETESKKKKKSIGVNFLRVTVHTVPLEMMIERILLVECFALVPLYFF